MRTTQIEKLMEQAKADAKAGIEREQKALSGSTPEAQTLTPEQRKLIVLRHVNGLAYTAIVHALGSDIAGEIEEERAPAEEVQPHSNS